MSTRSESFRVSWADVLKNQRIIYIGTVSGYGLICPDYKGADHYLQLPVSDEDLGSALLDSLSHSRFLRDIDDPELFDSHKVKVRYSEWVKKMVEKSGYSSNKETMKSSKKEAMKHLMFCRVRRTNGEISIEPTRRVSFDDWKLLEAEHFIRIPEDSTPASIGSALTLGLDRCI